MEERQIYAFASNKSTPNCSLCYTRGTGLILGAENGGERGV